MTELREQLAAGDVFAEATVDRETGIIRGVSLLGRTSANGRVYSESALADAVRLYAGTGIYLDHPTSKEQRERGGVRSVRDLAGRVTEAHRASDRIKGDVQALRGTVPGELLLAIAEQSPASAGLSHRASGTTKPGNGVDVVETITAVEGLDLVSEPATVAGLFESVQRERRVWESLVDAKIAAASFPASVVGAATRSAMLRGTEEELDAWIEDLEHCWRLGLTEPRRRVRSVERSPVGEGHVRRNGRRRWTDEDLLAAYNRAFGLW